MVILSNYKHSLPITTSHNLQRSKPSIDGLQVVCRQRRTKTFWREIATDGAQCMVRFDVHTLSRTANNARGLINCPGAANWPLC